MKCEHSLQCKLLISFFDAYPVSRFDITFLMNFTLSNIWKNRRVILKKEIWNFCFLKHWNHVSIANITFKRYESFISEVRSRSSANHMQYQRNMKTHSYAINTLNDDKATKCDNRTTWKIMKGWKISHLCSFLFRYCQERERVSVTLASTCHVLLISSLFSLSLDDLFNRI